MVCRIRKVEDGERPRMVAWVEVSKQIFIPESIARGKSADLLAGLITTVGGLVLQRTQQDGGTWIYEFAVPRSMAIPDGSRLYTVVSRMLAVYEKCLEDNLCKEDEVSASFFAIDQARPNVTSKVMGYCLRNPNVFTRRLVDAIKGWVSDELRIKERALREFYNDDILIGPPRPSRRELRELENTIATRHQYLKLISLFEKSEFEQARELVEEYKFV